jgi:glycosyltransferase involved in cell wall biosynthesis
MVNGIQLQQKLAGYGVASHLVRPGYDFGQFNCLNARNGSDQVILGGLYNTGKKRSGKRVDWIFEAVRKLKQEFNVNLWMFGVEKLSVSGDKAYDESRLYIDEYKQLPSPETKNEIYNQVDIWLAPTELEGLHKPPAEAMLTECPVVGTDAELSGMSDYLTHNETGLVADNNLESFIDQVRILVADKELRRRLGKQARQNVLVLGDRKANMLKMVGVLQNGY